jgi:hypothetical protein
VNKVLRWATIAIAGCGAFFILPTLIFGFSFLQNWVRVYSSDGPYFQWSYLTVGLVCVLFSGLGLGLAVRAFGRRAFV